MALDKKQFLEAYRTMRTIRDFEYRVSDEFGKGNIPGFLHLYAGQEAIATGMCMNLGDKDYIVSTHRGHGHCIAKGGDVGEMMKEIMARVGGSCASKGGSMHIAAIEKGMLGANAIVGGGPPLIVGAALSAKTLGTGSVGVSFTGDGGSNQGTTFEAMNLAVVLYVAALAGIDVALPLVVIGIGVAVIISIGSVSLPGSISFIVSIGPIALAMGVPIEPLALLYHRALQQDRSGAIVLGCAGMAPLCARLQQRLGVPVVDGVAVAVKFAEALASLGLGTSKRGDYAPPLPKVYEGWAAPLGSPPDAASGG